MPRYLEIEVSLRHIKPRIWRRMHLRPDLTFYDLHGAIQDAAGWGECHLWEFRGWGRRGGAIATMPDGPEDMLGWDEGPSPPAHEVRLSQFFRRASEKCLYVYDFGDNWEHEVKLRKTVEDSERFDRRLVAGRRAFPREDSGGAPGYYQTLAALGRIEPDPRYDSALSEEEAAEQREWIGDWDPDAFDLERAKRGFDQPRA